MKLMYLKKSTENEGFEKSGFRSYIFENNTPKDGVIDRVQLVNYPSKFGYLEPHTDPYLYQKF